MNACMSTRVMSHLVGLQVGCSGAIVEILFEPSLTFHSLSSLEPSSPTQLSR
jgi:hypothetical protein